MDSKQKLMAILPVLITTKAGESILKENGYASAANTVKYVGSAVGMALFLGALFEKKETKTAMLSGTPQRTWSQARPTHYLRTIRMRTIQQWYNNPETLQKLLDFLTKEEGMKPYVYLDSRGLKTIGIGHQIFAHETHLLKYTKTNPLPTSEVIKLLKHDILERALAKGTVFNRITGLIPEGLFIALISTCFNTGPGKIYEYGIADLINAGYTQNKKAIAAKLGTIVKERKNGILVANVGLILRRMREAAFYAPEYIESVFAQYKSNILNHGKDWSLREFNSFLALSRQTQSRPPNVT